MSVYASSGWGEWLLGDLASAASEVSRLLGPSEEVARLSLVPPTEGRSADVPTAVVVVPDVDAARRIQRRLLHGECVVDVYEPLFGDSWQAEINGLVLRIETEDS